jgi:NADH dehydrogenase
MEKLSTKEPRVVVIGAGFAGLAAVRGLAECKVQVILIDRHNYHLFQPLLYQVATAGLSPAQIAQPIRAILNKQKNCIVALGEIQSIDTQQHLVRGEKGEVQYDYLVIATGATHTYFGHPEWASIAPGLKTIEDALGIRRQILNAFEQAETSTDSNEQKALMTFIIVGGGPTGVEMAGAIAELAHNTLQGDFRRINPGDARIILIEAGPRLLTSFPEKLSKIAQRDLEHLGVEVMMNNLVSECKPEGVIVGEKLIPSHSIIWAAGVKASPAAQWLQAEHDRAGRVIVEPDLSVPGHSNIFVIGDAAVVKNKDGSMVPGLAPAAQQQGSYVANVIKSYIQRSTKPAPFEYKDKGTMATIGRGKAVVNLRSFTFSGFFAWLLWGVIHLMPLVGFRNRFMVAVDWLWAYFTHKRGVRLITRLRDQQSDL